VKYLLALILASQPAHAKFEFTTPAEPAVFTETLDYESGTGLTYSSTLVEFTSGYAALKNQYDSDLLFAATYGTNTTADFGGGTLTATTSGTVTVSGGKLNMDGADAANKYTNYSSANNFPTNGRGTLRMRATPGYTGSASTRQWYFASALNVLSSSNQFLLWHEAGATDLQVQILDNAGNSVCYMAGTWNPTAGVEYELEVNFDAVGNNWALYVDGNRISTRDSGAGTGTLDHTNTFFRIGDINTAAAYFDAKIDDVAIYNTVKNTGATRTTGYSIPTTKYTTTDPTVEQTTGFTATSLRASRQALRPQDQTGLNITSRSMAPPSTGTVQHGPTVTAPTLSPTRQQI
jgi:fibronectin-binding autotransporter adhesin